MKVVYTQQMKVVSKQQKSGTKKKAKNAIYQNFRHFFGTKKGLIFGQELIYRGFKSLYI